MNWLITKVCCLLFFVIVLKNEKDGNTAQFD